jgi:hypothetical protein
MKPGFIKALNLGPDEDRKEPSKLEKKVMKFFSVIERFCFRHKIVLLWRLKALDHLSEFPLKEALSFIWDDFVRVASLRHFRQQLRSGWAYFKKGYVAYDWDSSYAMDIFLWKLEKLADILDENDRHYGDKQHAKEIREAVRLINRVVEDDYRDEFEQELVEKYGDDIRYVADTKGFMGFMNKDKGPFKNRNTGCVTFHKREGWTPELHNEIEKAERRAWKKAIKKREREWKKALGIIERHFFEWWD